MSEDFFFGLVVGIATPFLGHVCWLAMESIRESVETLRLKREAKKADRLQLRVLQQDIEELERMARL